jgi:hypothetical protein
VNERVTLVDYGPEHRDDYLRLLREAWGGGAMSEREYTWWYDDNPAGSLRAVAVVDGEIAGASGYSLSRLVVSGCPETGQFSLHSVTGEKARGLGIFRGISARLLEQGVARDVGVALAFPNHLTAPLLLGPLGWSRIDGRRLWVRPLPRGIVSRLCGRPPAQLGPPRRDSDRVRRVDTFGPDQEAAYRRLAPKLLNHVERSEAFLRWRFADAPRGYRLFASPNGYAVLGRTQKAGAGVGLVLDLVAPPSEVPALLRRCVRECRGLVALLVMPTPLLPRRLLVAAGFVPTRSTFEFHGRSLARELDTRPQSWSVSLGDTDFF